MLQTLKRYFEWLLEYQEIEDSLCSGQKEDFSPNQLRIIRDVMAVQLCKTYDRFDSCAQYEEGEEPFQVQELEIINLCNAKLGCDTYASIGDFVSDLRAARNELNT